VVVEKPYRIAAGPRPPIGRGMPLAPISGVIPRIPIVPRAPVGRPVSKPPAPYKALKTIEECEAWAIANGGARNVYYQQIPELKVKGMGSKMTKAERLIHFNRVNKAIDDYMRQQGIRMPETDVFYITKTSRCRAARGWTREKGNIYGISFSPDWTDQNWADIAAWEKRTGKKWDWIKEKDGYATTVRHEYSHLMDYQHGITRSPEFEKLISQLRKDHGFFGSDISQYATTNVREYFAEAMSHYTSPLYGTVRPKFPKILEDFLESVLDKYREVK
jgi:hypothetical protein